MKTARIILIYLAVALAAAAEDNQQLSLHDAFKHGKPVAQGVVGVGVVDKYVEIRGARRLLHAPGNSAEARKRRRRAFDSDAERDGDSHSRERV